MNNTNTQNFIRQLKENWFVITFIGALVVGWTNFSNRLAIAEETQDEQQVKIEKLADSNAKLENAIIEIKSNYIFIKEALSK